MQPITTVKVVDAIVPNSVECFVLYLWQHFITRIQLNLLS